MHILILLLLAVLFLVGWMVRDALRAHRQGRERSLQLQPVASRLGLSLAQRDPAELESICERLLERSRLCGRVPLALAERDEQGDEADRGDDEQQAPPPRCLVLEGELEGERVTLVDLQPGEGEQQPTSLVAVESAADPATPLPRFYLQRRGEASPLVEIVGDEAARFVTIAEFEGKVSTEGLPGTDPPRALFGDDFVVEVHEEDLERLRPLLADGPVREVFAAHRTEPLCVESTGRRLLLHDGGRQLTGRKVEARLREAVTLLQALS